MSESNSQKLLNKGIKEAKAGQLKEAIHSFIEATNASFHIRPISLRVKIGLEILTFQNLCDAIKSIKEGDNNRGNSKYRDFTNYLDDYKEICRNTTSKIEIIRCKNTRELIGELTRLYQNQINLLVSEE